MRLHRFYVSQPLGEEVVIENVSLINQWLRVLRLSIGDFVILFNGEGQDITYSLSLATSKRCTFTYVQRSPSYIPKHKLTLAVSILKKDNFELVVQKAVELGVTRVVPILSDRSIKKEINRNRLDTIIIEATEQSGRGDLLHIGKILTLSQLIEEERKAGDENLAVLSLFGEPLASEGIRKKLSQSYYSTILVGPEGGWTDEEEKIFEKQKITRISLGVGVLRAETAAIVASSLPLYL